LLILLFKGLLPRDSLVFIKAVIFSILLFANLAFSEWPNVFGIAKLTAALLDRLSRYCDGNESQFFKKPRLTAIRA